MSALGDSLDAYLAIRRGLGTELVRPGAYLRRFVEFLDGEGAGVVTTALALRWATMSPSATACASRLDEARRFAAWLSATDPRTEVPPRGLLPDRYRRRPPYVYNDEEIERIVRQASRLPSDLGLRGQTYATLFGLLATAGLRLSEALALDRLDVDLRTGLLAIRRTKFGKSRFVPIHESTRRALQRYARLRDRLVPRAASPAFLLSERGTRITQCSARYNFVVVGRVLGLRPPNRGLPARRPRPQGEGPRTDHTFAPHTAPLPTRRQAPRLLGGPLIIPRQTRHPDDPRRRRPCSLHDHAG